MSVSGATVADMAARIGTDITAASPNIYWVTLNLGSNDFPSMPAEAAWKADLATILDAMNAEWPTAKIYVMRPWWNSFPTEADSVATWIADVISTRSTWAFVGPDERVYLENGDNGVTYTYDGLHPNAAGYILTATEWQTVLGY